MPTIYCIGRNFVAHAKELGNEVPKDPVVFLKPWSCLKIEGEIELPPGVGEIHHEAEWVVKLARGGRGISRTDALSYVEAHTIGIDVTARDLQSEAKKAGLPWTKAKGLASFAPIAHWVEFDLSEEECDRLTVSLEVGGEIRQSASTSLMIFKLPELIATLSHWFELEAGDVIFTGTPAGVAKLLSGDRLTARLGRDGAIVAEFQTRCR